MKERQVVHIRQSRGSDDCWFLELSCGHEISVTSRIRPKSKSQLCYRCSNRKTPEVGSTERGVNGTPLEEFVLEKTKQLYPYSQECDQADFWIRAFVAEVYKRAEAKGIHKRDLLNVGLEFDKLTRELLCEDEKPEP